MGLKKAGEFLRNHIIDSTTMLTESTPIYAAYEKLLVGMSDDVSINARVYAAGLLYGGLGFALAKGRDLSRNMFKITDKTKEIIQISHDFAYLAAFNLVTSPLLYYASGSRDPLEIAWGSALAVGVGAANGIPLGYAVDLFRDLTGIKKSERVPTKIRNLGSKTKRGLATLALAGSIVLTAGIYAITPDKIENYQQKQKAEQIQETNYRLKDLEQITYQ